MSDVVLCTDLDRTLLPNGLQTESPHSRQIFNEVIRRCGVTLVYVSGRDLKLLQDAIAQYAIPEPHYAIGDVGTSMYQSERHQWHPVEAWTRHLAEEWSPADRERLTHAFSHYPHLRLQEAYKQGRFKLSFYTDPKTLTQAFTHQLERDLAAAGYHACLITSVDETRDLGLVDTSEQLALTPSSSLRSGTNSAP